MADGRSRPTCKKCGRQHLNFVACVQAEQFAADQEEKARRLRNLSRPVLRPRDNDWHNRYVRDSTRVQIADNVVVLKRKPLHEMTRPEPPKAA